MKKITFSLIALALFLGSLLPNYFQSTFKTQKVEAAGEDLVISDLQATSVVLTASHLSADKIYGFQVSDVLKKKLPYYNQSSDVTTDSTGSAKASFSGLSPNGHYSATVRVKNTNGTYGPVLDMVYITTPLDLSALNATIKYAQDKYDTSTDGDDYGQYQPGARGNLQIAITNANLINTSPSSFPNATQADVDKMLATLNKAVANFEFQKIITHKTVPTDNSTNNTNTNTTTKGSFDLSYKGGGVVPSCPASGCGFNEAIKLINNVINFLLFVIATPLAALAIAYAGFLYLTAGGNSENISKAKTILKNVVFGYVIALAAWLIVNTIFVSLGVSNSFLTN